MTNSKKKIWTQPLIRQFKDGGEVWEYFKSRGSPEELARLRAMLKASRSRTDEDQEKALRRRA